MTLEWIAQFHGERRQLFSHAGRTGQVEGGGVDLKGLAGGDASYTIPYTQTTSKGSYICSVLVPPVRASVDVNLQIEGEEETQRLDCHCAVALPSWLGSVCEITKPSCFQNLRV